MLILLVLIVMEQKAMVVVFSVVHQDLELWKCSRSFRKIVKFQTISPSHRKRCFECAYIAYFQANTNTYGPLDKIKKMIAPFLNKEDVKGYPCYTRHSCLNEEIVQYLSTINKQKDLYIELGLQTIHEQTSKLINRVATFRIPGRFSIM